MADEKIQTTRNLEDGRIEMRTVNKTTNTETWIIAPKDDVKQLHKDLHGQRKRLEDTLSKKVGELKQFVDAEEEFGKKYTDEDVNRFNEIAQLADSRNNVHNIREQISATKALIDEANEKIKRIENVIPELMRK